MISFYIAVLMIWTSMVKAQDDDKSLVHKIGFDVRPSYVAPLANSSEMTAMETGLLYEKRLHSI